MENQVALAGAGGDVMKNGGGGVTNSDDERKIFIGGLSWESTEKDLREHFGKYGEVESVNVKTDPNSGRSRGFAFLVFTEVAAVDKALAAGDHIVNGKKVDPKKAKARHGHGKIFVGGIKPELSDEDITKFFGQFGTIIEVEMPFDKVKNQRKGFCFITFEEEGVAKDLVKTPKKTINGTEVDVKKAIPKQDSMNQGWGGQGGGWGNQYSGWNQQGYGYGAGYDYSGYGYGYGQYGGYNNYNNYNYNSSYPAAAAYGSYGGYNQGGYTANQQQQSWQ